MDEFNDMSFQSSDIGMSSDMGSDIVTDMGADMDTEINSDMNSSVDMAINTELNSDLNTEMDEPEADIDFEALEDQPIVTASETEEMEKKVEEINQEDERDELEEIQKEQINETEEQKEEQEEVKGYLDDDNIWHGDSWDEPLYGKDGELRDLNEEEVPLEDGELEEYIQKDVSKEVDEKNEKDEIRIPEEFQKGEQDEGIYDGTEVIPDIEDEEIYDRPEAIQNIENAEIYAEKKQNSSKEERLEEYVPYEETDEYKNKIAGDAETEEIRQGFIDHLREYNTDETNERIKRQEGINRNSDVKQDNGEQYINYDETQEYKDIIKEKSEKEGEKLHKGFLNHLKKWNKK